MLDVDRHTWAVELLDLRPSQHVLEIGCGTGTASALAAERLTTGSITAIDRSATAIARATATHPAIRFLEATVEALDGSFDVAFAINVNLFWTGDAAAECAALRRLLTPAGVLVVVYEPPPARVDELGHRVAATLTAQAWTPTIILGPDPTPSLVAVRARPT